jgi:hypothetical protein
MNRYLPLQDTRLKFAVGTAFDFHTARILDCTAWIKVDRLQRFHRLLQDPKLFRKRSLGNNPAVIHDIALQLAGLRAYPPQPRPEPKAASAKVWADPRCGHPTGTSRKSPSKAMDRSSCLPLKEGAIQVFMRWAAAASYDPCLRAKRAIPRFLPTGAGLRIAAYRQVTGTSTCARFLPVSRVGSRMRRAIRLSPLGSRTRRLSFMPATAGAPSG